MAEGPEHLKRELAISVTMLYQLITETLARLPLAIAIPAGEHITETVETMVVASRATMKQAEDGWISVETGNLIAQAIMHWLSASYCSRFFALFGENAAYEAGLFAAEFGGDELAQADRQLTAETGELDE